MFGGRGKKPSGPRKGKPKLIEMTATLEEVFNGTMKTVKIKRQSFVYSELVSVSLVKEREAKMFRNVLNVKVKEESLGWFNWAQACTLNPRLTVLTVKVKERP